MVKTYRTQWDEWLGDTTPQDFCRGYQTRIEASEEIAAFIDGWQHERVEKLYTIMADEAVLMDYDYRPTCAELRARAKADWEQEKNAVIADLIAMTDDAREELSNAISVNLPPGFFYCRVTTVGTFVIQSLTSYESLEFAQAEALLHIMEKGSYESTHKGIAVAIKDARVVSASRGGA